MSPMQAHTIVALLQKEPLYYRNFGIWWWHVKSELKRNGFDQDQLQHLGDFVDTSVLRYYKGLSTQERDEQAYDYQYARTFVAYNNSQQYTPDGELYLVRDQDAE